MILGVCAGMYMEQLFEHQPESTTGDGLANSMGPRMSGPGLGGELPLGFLKEHTEPRGGCVLMRIVATSWR